LGRGDSFRLNSRSFQVRDSLSLPLLPILFLDEHRPLQGPSFVPLFLDASFLELRCLKTSQLPPPNSGLFLSPLIKGQLIVVHGPCPVCEITLVLCVITLTVCPSAGGQGRPHLQSFVISSPIEYPFISTLVCHQGLSPHPIRSRCILKSVTTILDSRAFGNASGTLA